MTKKADKYRVTLKIHSDTKWVHNCPPPHGCKFKSKEACQTASVPREHRESGKRGTVNTAQSYVYMDVGKWAGNIYNFGLICGAHVWLCRFTPNQTHSAIPYEACRGAPAPLKIFDKEMCFTKHGFVVEKYAYIHSKSKPSGDILYLILPDMHMPALPHRAEFANKSYAEIRNLHKDINRIFKREYVPMSRRDQIVRYAAFRRAEDADIFGNAGKTLYDFLDCVTTWAIDPNKLDRKLNVVQLGDMYELWQGMGEWSTFFDDDPKGKGYVFEESAINHIEDRIEGIETQNRLVFMQFKYLDTLKACEYLYGNHDVYLVDKMRQKDQRWHKALGDRLPRKTNMYQDYLAFEHGHRMDDWNDDGDWKGAFITELVYWLPWLRVFDPDRRPTYYYQTAADVYYHNSFLNKPISVFVMAHTHEADLKYVDFSCVPRTP